MNKLYLLTQGVQGGYDTYDSCVVVAASAEEARRIHPNYWTNQSADPWDPERTRYSGWAFKPEQVTAEYLGLAHESLVAGSVVCASFNAS